MIQHIYRQLKSCNRFNHKRSSAQQQAFALIVVVWVVLIASIILLSVQKTSGVYLATSNSQLASVQARWLARAGIEKAISTLESDITSYDSITEYWYDDPLEFEKFELTNGYSFTLIAGASQLTDDTQLRFGLTDASSKLNINDADQKQLKQLIPLDDSQLAAILDWRDGNNQTRPAGVESDYYQQLDFPYQIRNGKFKTSRELLLVRDVDSLIYAGEDSNQNNLLDPYEDDGQTNEPMDNADGQLNLGLAGLTTVYSYDKNESSDGGERINLSDASKNDLTQKLDFTDALADGLIKRRDQKKFEKLIDLLDVKPENNNNNNNFNSNNNNDEKVNQITLKWLAENIDVITLTDDELLPGKINVNTARRQVLLSLPDITEDAADSIVAYRNSSSGPIYSIGQLLTANLLTEKQFKSAIELLTVRSNVFTITSRGTTPWGISHTVTAVVDRGSQPIKILYWYHSK